MSSELNLSKIPVLHGQTSYREWALELRFTAQCTGCWKAILGSNTTTSSDAAEIDKVDQREFKAIGIIGKTVSSVLKVELDEYRIKDDTAKPPTSKEPTAKELWNYLKEKFEKKDGVSALLDLSLITRAKLVDDGTLEAQLNKFQDIRSRCAMNDIKFEDWQYAALILLALPAPYQRVSDAFLLTGTAKDLKSDAVRAKILETENRYKADSDPGANILSVKGKGREKTNPPNSERKCFKCGKKGHMANHCRSKAKDKPKAGPSKGDKSSLNVVENSDAESDSPVFCYFGAPESWLMDSGATDHMTPFGSDFRSYTAYAESPRAVILGDGSTRLRILGKGTTERWVETSPHNFRLLVLEDVLHVDGIKRRFLSASRFDNKGFAIKIDKSRLTISKGNFQFSGTRTGTLYTCTMHVEKPIGARSLNSVEVLPIKTWHDRMGHLNWDAIKKVQSDNPPLLGVKLDASKPPSGVCEGCAAGKAKRRTFKSSESRTTRSTEPIERIHADLTGPMETTSIGGHRYACVFTCDSTSHVWVYFLKSKDQTLKTFKVFVLSIEKLTGHKIKIFHSDRGGEFMSGDFDTFLEEQGITRETSAPRTPQQNGVAERMMQTLGGGARAMLHHSGMSDGFWAEAMGVAAHVLNRAPRKGLNWRTPHELLFGRVPEVTYLRVFGCRAWVFNEKGKKWDPKAKSMILVGYEPSSKAYRLWNPVSRSIVVSTNVRFSEHEFPNKRTPKPPPTPVVSLSEPRPLETHVLLPWFAFEDEPSPPVAAPAPAPVLAPAPAPAPPNLSTLKTPPRISSPSTRSSSSSPQLPPEAMLSPSDPENEPGTSTPEATEPLPRRSSRKRKKAKKFVASSLESDEAKREGDDFDEAYLQTVEFFAAIILPGEPSGYREAANGPCSKYWNEAMGEEIESLEKMGTWEKVPLPENRKPISCKWVYRIKYNSDGKVSRYKARVVARGFNQIEGLDFDETYAPVTRLETIRLLLAIAVEKDWEIRQVDVKTAYLYGDLDEEIYMQPPPGYGVPEGHVLRL